MHQETARLMDALAAEPRYSTSAAAWKSKTIFKPATRRKR
jgi:hypothetical protein